MPNTDSITDATVLMRFLPWSSEVPESCHADSAYLAGTDPLDEPIVDIDPELINEED